MLLKIGPLTIYSYGVMLALSVVVCASLLSRDMAQAGFNKDLAYDLIFTCVLWGILGARIFYIFLNLPYFMSEPMEIPMLQKGGLAWQGGFLGGTVAGILFVRRKKLPLRQMLDITAPYIALGQAIGRIGCFFNGCCYGKPVAWGIYFPVHQARLHPTQLYETAGLFIIFVLLKFATPKEHRPGQIFVCYLWLAAIERFTVEFYRADHEMLYAGLSLFQWVAVGIFSIGSIYFIRVRRT